MQFLKNSSLNVITIASYKGLMLLLVTILKILKDNCACTGSTGEFNYGSFGRHGNGVLTPYNYRSTISRKGYDVRAVSKEPSLP